MQKEVILDNDNVSLWYYPQEKIIHHQFHKYSSGDNLRNPLTKGVEILEQKRAQKWLSDDRKNTVIGEEDMQWTKSIWRPRVIKAGWKYWAIVLPEKAIGKMNMNRIIKEYAETGVTVKVFSEPEEALSWLGSQ